MKLDLKREDFDPRRQPKAVRVLLWATLGTALFFGIVLNKGVTFAHFLFVVVPAALILGLITAAVILAAIVLMSKTANQHNQQKLERYFAERGFCAEMAETLNATMPAMTDQETVLRAFILVMAEQYKEAEEAIAHINEPALFSRTLAMVKTAKLRLYFMTGRFEKTERIFSADRAALDSAYDARADFLEQYCPYADDALEYYMIAAVCCDLLNMPEDAAEYRRKAEFQASNRSVGEMEIIKSVLELNRLYAAGKFEPAHKLENDLQGEIASLDPAVPYGIKQNLKRCVEQARVFSAENLQINPALLQQRYIPEDVGMKVPEGLSEF